jgi:hypothetical protein
LYQGVAAVAVGLIVVLLAGDYQRFQKDFVQKPDNLDLSVKMVLDATEF